MTSISFENPLGIAQAAAHRDILKHALQQAAQTHFGGRNIKAIFIDGRNIRIETGEERLTILFNAQPPAIATQMDVHVQPFFGQYIGITRLMQGKNAAYDAFTDENGFDLAYYDRKNADLYIPFNIFDLGDISNVSSFLVQLLAFVLTPLEDKLASANVWGKGEESVLKERLKGMLQRHDNDNEETMLHRLKDAQDGEAYHRQELRKNITNVREYMEKLEHARNKTNTLDERVGRDFTALANHGNVKRIEVLADKIVVHTHPIIGMSDVGKRYNFGSFKIEHEIGNTRIRFFGDTPKRGLWTATDPHPHVSGSNNEACLGNIGEAVAQLSSMHEYMALFSIAIEFLKAANTTDSAGKHVVKWDEVDEHGALISKGKKSLGKTCSCCDESFDDDELFTVYDSADDDDYWNEGRVCETCRDEHYRYNEGHGEHIHCEADVWDEEESA